METAQIIRLTSELDPNLPQAILSLVLRFGNHLALRETDDVTGYGPSWAKHLLKIRAQIRAQAPIRFVLPAFPAKSPNREKTLGTLPDLGEVLALRRLETLCRDIGEIYAPGAEVWICSDGRVFSDLVLVEDETVTAYARAIESIIARFGFRHLKTFHLEDALAVNDFDHGRKALVQKYAQSVESIRDNVKSDAAARCLFNGIHRFIFEDRVAMSPFVSRERVRRESKVIAYEMVQRSDAWGRLVEDAFPDAVRLSIHPQIPGAAKIGVRLVESGDMWRTPWHSAVLIENGVPSLIRRRDAELRAAQLAYFENEYAYFALSDSREVPHVGL